MSEKRKQSPKKGGRRKQNKTTIIKREPDWELPEDAFHLLQDVVPEIVPGINVPDINEKSTDETNHANSNVDGASASSPDEANVTPSSIIDANIQSDPANTISEELTDETSQVQSNLTDNINIKSEPIDVHSNLTDAINEKSEQNLNPSMLTNSIKTEIQS